MTSSWKAEMGAKRVENKQRRVKARERAAQRRKDELVGYKPGDREYEEITQRHQAEDWDRRQANAHRRYDQQYGAAAHRKNVRQMEQFARRREMDNDFIQRVKSGDVDFEGDLADIKTGKAWEQGQLDAYKDYDSNRNYYKRNPQEFDYDSYFPNDPRRSRRKPTYEQYMGQYYDPNYVYQGGRRYGNPFR